MNQGLEVNIKGIKCDNENCDYMDTDVSVEDYPQWLNKPCPKCGSNLLTEADYNNVKMMLDLAKTLEPLMKNGEDDRFAVANIKMNGSGQMDFEITIVEDEENKMPEV